MGSETSDLRTKIEPFTVQIYLKLAVFIFCLASQNSLLRCCVKFSLINKCSVPLTVNFPKSRFRESCDVQKSCGGYPFLQNEQ